MSDKKSSISIKGNVEGSIVSNESVSVGTFSFQKNAAVPPNDAVVDQADFDQDVADILGALVTAKEELEIQQRKQLTDVMFLMEQQKVHEKTIADISAMIEELWVKEVSEDFKTSLQKIEGTKVLQTILNSKVFSILAKSAIS